MQVGAWDAVFLGDARNLFGVAFSQRREEHARLDRVEKCCLLNEGRLYRAHDLADGGVGLGCDACKFPLVLYDFEQGFASYNLPPASIQPRHSVERLPTLESEPVHAQD